MPKISGPYILLLVRDRKANTWEALCEEFGLESRKFFTLHSFLLHELESLREAGLVEFTSHREGPWGNPGIQGEIRITESWVRIQNALDISLAQIARIDPEYDLIVRPSLGRPIEAENKHDLFVLMPFDELRRPVYDDHIKRVASGLAVSVARADDFFSAHSVIADVWAGIFSAKVVIADCSGRNPNVFYEIGLAHVLGKPVILITENPDDIPFDVRHIRFIHYIFTPRGMADFERVLGETVRSVLDGMVDTM